MQKFAPPEEQATAKQYIEQLHRRDFSDIEQAADPSIAGPTLESTLVKMADAIPPEPPTSIQLVGANRFSLASEGTFLNLTFEYRFGDRFVLANVATKTLNGKLAIIGFRVRPEVESLESQNRFTLAGKQPLQA